MRCAARAAVHHLQRSELNQLDAGAPWIGDVGDGCAAPRDPAVRLVEPDALCLDLLDEGLQVPHVETDIILILLALPLIHGSDIFTYPCSDL
jgi:hypothetical protein